LYKAILLFPISQISNPLYKDIRILNQIELFNYSQRRKQDCELPHMEMPWEALRSTFHSTGINSFL
jgi:hypothetical protein